jgi:hypothetical protein
LGNNPARLEGTRTFLLENSTYGSAALSYAKIPKLETNLGETGIHKSLSTSSDSFLAAMPT